MRHGQGTFVSARSRSGQLAAHRVRLVDELRQVARQAAGLGLSPEELHELLDEAASGMATPVGADGESQR
jgi:hypothetical protein